MRLLLGNDSNFDDLYCSSDIGLVRTRILATGVANAGNPER